MGLVLADLLFAGRAGVLHIIEGIDATWYAGATPETERAHHLRMITLVSTGYLSQLRAKLRDWTTVSLFDSKTMYSIQILRITI